MQKYVRRSRMGLQSWCPQCAAPGPPGQHCVERAQWVSSARSTQGVASRGRCCLPLPRLASPVPDLAGGAGGGAAGVGKSCKRELRGSPLPPPAAPFLAGFSALSAVQRPIQTHNNMHALTVASASAATMAKQPLTRALTSGLFFCGDLRPMGEQVSSLPAASCKLGTNGTPSLPLWLSELMETSSPGTKHTKSGVEVGLPGAECMRNLCARTGGTGWTELLLGLYFRTMAPRSGYYSTGWRSA
mmetsp:Transcript_111079/g.313345  ORF Transcript_111079/g.313345 Transcript_111079/m.313345 type:complete len:244 (+) Transcript_111079:516-1247(+)